MEFSRALRPPSNGLGNDPGKTASDAICPTASEQARLPEPGFALSLQASMLVHPRSAPAAMAFTSEIAQAYACSRVTLGFVHGGYTRLFASSHGHDGELVGEPFDSLAAAMDEACEQATSIFLPAPADVVSVIRLAASRVVQRQGGAIACIPLIHQGKVVGALCCEWPSVPQALATIVSQIENVISLTGPVIHLMYLRDLPLSQRLMQATKRGLEALRHRDNDLARVVLISAAVGIITFLFVPVSYRIGGQARIEGQIQRSLVAPTNGYLKSTSVRPGDRVSKGQVLLELADEDLLLQRRKWASELAQQENVYANATAGFDRGQIVIALSRVEEAEAQLALVDSDLSRSRVAAPFDGIVIQGDLNRSLGAPVERGTVLLVLAPSGQYRTVVEVDERDITRMKVGQRGTLSLSALPWDNLPITVKRITPVAHSSEGNNVFDVEAEINVANDQIGPGLQGIAKISVGRQPLAWIWGHRLLAWGRQLIWTWLP